MTWKITGAPGTGDDLLYSQAGTPTLDLRFASSKSLNDNVSGQNLIDFTRGGNGVGTYVGSDGLIKNSVVNLLYPSQFTSFATSAAQNIWYETVAELDATVNAGVAPDGTTTAALLAINTNTAFRAVFNRTGATTQATYCYSAYLKAASTSTSARLLVAGESTLTNYCLADFTLSGSGSASAATVAGTATAPTAPTIQAVGNGWYRCTLHVALISPPNITCLIYPGTATAQTTASQTLVWGAQLEQSDTAGEYVKTTSSISGAPRFDHDPETGESLGLLIEESRANLLLNSATLATQDVTVTAVAHTLSFYGTGTVTLSGTHSATVVGTGAYPTRTTLTFTPTAGTLTVTVSGTVQYANLEIGSFATSWIPTTSTTVTRNADVASTTQAYSTRGAFVKFRGVSSGTRPLISLDDNTANERIELLTSGTDPKLLVTDGGSVVADLDAGTIAAGAEARAAARFLTDDYGISINGSAAVVDTSGTLPTTNRLRLGSSQAGGYLNGHLARVAIFDRTLTTLQAISS